MKQFYLTLTGLMIASISFGQIVFQSNFDTWTDIHTPTGWLGSKTSIDLDSVVQVTTGATFGTNLAQLINIGGPHRRFTSTGISLTEGATYEVEVWCKGNGSIRTGLFDNDLDGNDFGYALYNPYQIINSTEVISFVQTIMPDTTYSLCELIISTIEADMFIDRVEVRIGEPQEPVQKSIYEIQYTTALDGNSPETGTYVITTGVVTALASNGYWIQNGNGPWNGIRVIDSSNTPNIGDDISVTGTVEEYFNFTRINNVTAMVVNGTSSLPAATTVGTGALNSEEYEGVLVTTVGVCTTELNNFNEWLINDGTGEIMVNDEMFMYTPSVGVNYSVTGPLNYSFNLFKIEPRNTDDVSIFSSLNELNSLSVNVYPNPTSDMLTIEHAVTGNVRAQLFDVNGRAVLDFVMTAAREQVDLSSFTEGVYLLMLSNGTVAGTHSIEVKH